MSDVKGRDNFFTWLSAKLTRKIVLPIYRARLIDASVCEGLVRQLCLRPREVSSLYPFFKFSLPTSLT